MGDSAPTAHASATEVGKIELSLPSEPELLSIPRMTTAAVAAQAGFDIEEVEDLRLAIEELCISLSGGQLQGRFHLRLEVAQNSLNVRCTFQPAEPPPQGELASELSRHLLDALVDEHGFDQTPSSRSGWLRKAHRLAAPE